MKPSPAVPTIAAWPANPKPASQRMSRIVRPRLAPAQYRALAKAAADAGLPFTTWLRALGIHETRQTAKTDNVLESGKPRIARKAKPNGPGAGKAKPKSVSPFAPGGGGDGLKPYGPMGRRKQKIERRAKSEDPNQLSMGASS